MDEATLKLMRVSLYQNDHKQYKVGKDFDDWILSFRQSVAVSMNGPTEKEVDMEVLRVLPSKMTGGPALEAYTRIPKDDLKDYDKVVEFLRNEFTDPAERTKFEENLAYVTRKKRQKIEDFVEAVKKSQRKYHVSSLKGKEKERQDEIDGVRRFIAGIRDKKGSKSKDLVSKLKFYLHDLESMTWVKAIDVVRRWEATCDDSSSEESGDDSTEESSIEESSISDTEKGAKMSGNVSKAKSAAKMGFKDESIVASLTEQVEANTVAIESLQAATQDLSDQLSSFIDDTNNKFDMILSEIRGLAEFLGHPAEEGFE